MKLIDADELKKRFHAGDDTICNYIVSKIHEAIDLTKGYEWIPIERALPKNDEDVLMCYDTGRMEVGCFYADNNIYPSEFEDLDETGWYDVNGDPIEDPIAWMPLIEPYKAESEEV